MNWAVLTLIFSPLIGFLANSFWKWNKKTSSILGCGASFVSLLSSFYLFIFYFNQSKAQIVFLQSWLKWESLHIDFSFLIDPLSLIMILIITGIGFLIHLFSIDYMKNDSRIGRYFSYLNLFIFNMLILVLADNLLLMFVGWEGVGLCSYLLIGFWFDKKEKALAGMKAFIANRIGDAGFLIGIFLFFYLFGSLNFSALDQGVASSSSFLILLTCLFLFLGATGKSAQLPLYVWLPSAMAGPTPVSALIHAATMVTAGIYLIIRTKILWIASPLALHVVGVIGVLTALLGAYLACKVWDVKKILAYSTMSQLGYMFLALGVGAFSTSLFHLLTHAFFKACLFLSAGSLIHGLNGEQDIRKMGGLSKKMPYTYISFLIGALALIGIPPLSGFFSKDEILYHSFHNGYYLLWALALIGAGLTAFYTTKTLYFIFWKSPQSSHDKAHEGGWMMRIPLLVLAFFSLIAGWINWPHFLPKIGLPHQWLGGHWLQEIKEGHEASIWTELILAVGSSVFVISVSLISYSFLIRNKKIKFLSQIFQWNWSLDMFYQKYFIRSLKRFSEELMESFEVSFLQKGIYNLGQYFLTLRKVFVSLQNGHLQNYLLFMVCGFLIFILVTLFR